MLSLSCVFVALLFVVPSPSLGAIPSDRILLCVAYPPNEFGSAGAVVSVDPQGGKWEIVGRFKWPAAVFGRPALYSPTYYFDHDAQVMYLDFGADFGYLITVDMQNARVGQHFMHADPFFVGFTNMKLNGAGKLIGTSPVGNDNGIFSFGYLDVSTHKYVNQSLVKFKAMMDDSDYFDRVSETYYVQADYDQRKSPMCPGGKELCLLALDAKTGALRSTVKTNFTVYKFSQTDPSTQVQAWIQGFDSFCPGSDSNFVFGTVDVGTGAASPQACIAKKIVIQEEPWISAFSTSGNLFTTGNRYAQTTQLLAFSTKTGSTLLDTSLPGLAKELHPAEGFYYIWGIGFSK